MQYATADDLTAQGVSPLPDNVDAYLRVASGLVTAACAGAVYAVDADWMPTGARTANAMRDATTTQVTMWLASGINPLSGGMDLPAPAVVSRGQGDRSVAYADLSTSVTVQASRQDAATSLSYAAWLCLSQAGLTAWQPATVAP